MEWILALSLICCLTVGHLLKFPNLSVLIFHMEITVCLSQRAVLKIYWDKIVKGLGSAHSKCSKLPAIVISISFFLIFTSLFFLLIPARISFLKLFYFFPLFSWALLFYLSSFLLLSFLLRNIIFFLFQRRLFSLIFWIPQGRICSLFLTFHGINIICPAFF